MKYCFLLVLCVYSSIGSFPGLHEPLYWSQDELLSLSEKGDDYLKVAPMRDQKRLKNLQQKRSDVFWHLFDPYVGKKIYKNIETFDKSISWNFAYDDFLSKNGRKIKIVTIDTVPCVNKFKEEYFFQFNSNSAQICTKSNFLVVGSDEWNSLVNFWPKKMKNFEMTHGFQNFHLIKQLAPENVEIITLSIFDENGYANKETFLQALEYCRSLQPDILLLALKFKQFDFTKNKIDQKINKILQSFSYIVAAAGNNGTNKEAYPARLNCVTFDVGAYDRHHNTCQFSQYEQNIGPKIVAPGKNIVSFGLVPSKDKPQMVMTSGTSMAAAFFTGFLATVLSKFDQIFTRKQLLTIMYSSSIPRYDKKSLLGALDMRHCLFVCRVLERLKQIVSPKLWQAKFDRYHLSIKCIDDVLRKNQLIQNGDVDDFVKKLYTYAQDKCLDKIIDLFCDVLLDNHGIGCLIDNYGSKLLKHSKFLNRSVVGRLKYPLYQRIKGEK